uniref:Uncharacterized protein n=1 Tax=Oryza sativa subsp. japonica TaxID=39947 RepID=Q2QQ78_ORYSJ|nr:hypothetical protein LOC_Os12g31950 [Oryza sativa Japonica Group]
MALHGGPHPAAAGAEAGAAAGNGGRLLKTEERQKFKGKTIVYGSMVSEI